MEALSAPVSDGGSHSSSDFFLVRVFLIWGSLLTLAGVSKTEELFDLTTGVPAETLIFGTGRAFSLKISNVDEDFFGAGCRFGV